MNFNTGSGGGTGAGGSSGGTGGPPPPRVSRGVSGGDFDYRELIPSFVQTVREVLFNPVGFFRSIRKEGDFLNPLLFAIICALITGVIGGILSLIFSLIRGAGFGGALGSLIANIIFIPIGTAIFLFIWAGIYHLLVLLVVRPSHAGYEATFRALAYASAVQAVAWLAYIPPAFLRGKRLLTCRFSSPRRWNLLSTSRQRTPSASRSHLRSSPALTR